MAKTSFQSNRVAHSRVRSFYFRAKQISYMKSRNVFAIDVYGCMMSMGSLPSDISALQLFYPTHRAAGKVLIT